MNKSLSFYNQVLKDKIFRFSLRILGNQEDAKDVVQDVFEKLWKSKKNLDKYNSVEALSMTMSRNICLNKIKHQKVRDEKLKNENKENSDYHKQDYENIELSNIVKSLINKLPEKQKMTIHLRDVEGMEFKEISEVLEIDITSVRMNLSRARKTVKEELSKIMNYGL